jgi:hypothetical protein
MAKSARSPVEPEFALTISEPVELSLDLSINRPVDVDLMFALTNSCSTPVEAVDDDDEADFAM